MSNMVLFTVVALCLSSAVVKADCDPGKSQLTDFDYEKFTGLWHIVSANSEEFTKYSCWDDDYEDGPDGTVLYSDYTYPNGSRVHETAQVELQGSGFKLEYPEKTEGFNTEYEVLATDYEHFAIIGGCPPDIKDVANQLVYVQFRDVKDAKEKKDEVREILKKYNMDYDNFHSTCNSEIN